MVTLNAAARLGRFSDHGENTRRLRLRTVLDRFNRLDTAGFGPRATTRPPDVSDLEARDGFTQDAGMNPSLRLLGVVAVLVGPGCFSPDQVVPESPETDNPNTSSGVIEGSASTGAGTTGATPTSTSSNDATTSSETSDSSTGTEPTDDDSGSTGDSPSCSLENGDSPLFRCNTFTQDCPEGEKCVPIGAQQTECVPIPDKPAGPGDTCTAPRGAFKGNDDCGVGLVCDGVGGALNTGTCTRLCGCDGDSPECPSSSTCVFDQAPVCRRRCNPITDEWCGLGDECVPNEAGPFACVEQTGAASFGEDCNRSSDCDDGYCAPAAAVPGCETDSCCTPYCDLSDPLASQGCPAFSDGQACVVFFTTDAPEGFEDVGLCAS